MKIDELTGYRKHPLYDILSNSTSMAEFVENLKANGYQKYLIGEGWYSGVFARPEDRYVIKIFQKDPGYEYFLTYMKSNQHNPHVPKIKGKPVRFLKKYTIVRLEKLRAVGAHQKDYDVFQRIRDYVYDHSSTKAPALLNQQWIEKTYPQLPEILDSLAQNRHSLDLHQGNVMFRGDVPVITDPYVDLIEGGIKANQPAPTSYASVYTVPPSEPPQPKPAPVDAPKKLAFRRPPDHGLGK
jgi:hypothetical protein